MQPVERYHIYSLMCAIIVADKKVKNVEVDTFVSLVKGFQTALKDPSPEDEQSIRAWFDDHHAGIAAQIESDDRSAFLEKQAAGLKAFAFKRQIIQSLMSIAVADGEFHKSEEKMIDVISRYWGPEYVIFDPS